MGDWHLHARLSHDLLPWLTVNNVGTNIRKPTIEYSEEEYDKVLGVNLKATYRTCQQAHGLLKAAGKSSVVMVGSVAGGPASIKSGTLYAMSKGMLPLQIWDQACHAPSPVDWCTLHVLLPRHRCILETASNCSLWHPASANCDTMICIHATWCNEGSSSSLQITTHRVQVVIDHSIA